MLADAATTMCRGAAAAAAAAETARKTFEEGATGDALPRHTVHGGEIGVVDALVALGFAASKGEARRLIKGGGARLDGEKVADEAAVKIGIASGTGRVCQYGSISVVAGSLNKDRIDKIDIATINQPIRNSSTLFVLQ